MSRRPLTHDPDSRAMWRLIVASSDPLRDWTGYPIRDVTPPPPVDGYYVAQLVGALCIADVREAVVAALAPDVERMVDARIAMRRGEAAP